MEEKIRRSLFITTMSRAETTGEARSFVKSVRAEFEDASHNCWAYVVGRPGSTAEVGLSDDGEPHGTAGRPMLTTLLHSGVGDVAAVVTRYFGGAKLGKGGLVRAYSGGVKLALASLTLAVKMPKTELDLVVGHSQVTLLLRMAPEWGAEILEQEFSADARFRLLLPTSRVEEVRLRVADLTSGRGRVKVVRQV